MLFLIFFMNGFQRFLLTLLLVSSYHKDSQKRAEFQAHSTSVIFLWVREKQFLVCSFMTIHLFYLRSLVHRAIIFNIDQTFTSHSIIEENYCSYILFFSALFPDLLDLNDDSVQGNLFPTRCTCGKNVKDPSKIACTTSRCPCNKQSQACSRKCRCYNCNNENITKFVRPSGIETRRRNGGPCACGKSLNKEDQDRVSCKDGKRKTKCPCATEGIGCTEKCKCRNCGNTIQTGGVSTALGTGRKRRRETVSSYKRKCGTEFLTCQNVPVTQGPWRLMETLCLIVCKELLAFNELPINSLNVATLYNFVAESDKLEELSLIIARKSTA